jgi:hypothetical protein
VLGPLLETIDNEPLLITRSNKLGIPLLVSKKGVMHRDKQPKT